MARRYQPKTAKEIHRIINAESIQTNEANNQNHSAQIISPILLTNSCNQEITQISFDLAYQVTSAEQIGESNATISEIKKLRITMAKNHL